MKKILIIGGGAMGSAFSIPCLDNNHKVFITEPYSQRFIKSSSVINKGFDISNSLQASIKFFTLFSPTHIKVG